MTNFPQGVSQLVTIKTDDILCPLNSELHKETHRDTVT